MWFEITATISIGSAPIRQRYRRSFRQCPKRDTRMTTRIFAVSSRKSKVMPKRAAVSPKPAVSVSSVAPVSGTKLTRMKKLPVSTSSYCALSVMLQP